MWDPSPFGGEVKYHTFCADNDKKLCSWGPGSLTIIPICSNNNCDPATKPDCPVESPTDGCAGTLEKVDWD